MDNNTITLPPTGDTPPDYLFGAQIMDEAFWFRRERWTAQYKAGKTVFTSTLEINPALAQEWAAYKAAWAKVQSPKLAKWAEHFKVGEGGGLNDAALVIAQMQAVR